MSKGKGRRALSADDVAAKAERRRRDDLVRLCPEAMPTAQRSADLIAAVEAPKIGDGPRTATNTVRKLTRVERMLSAGVLDPHEADACEWFAGIAALAWDTTGCTANLSGNGGGGSRAHAPDTLAAKQQDVQDARDDYRDAVSFMTPSWRALFEASVCRNETLGPAAAVAFPELGERQASHRASRVLKLYANKLHERFASRMGWRDAPAAAAVRDRPVKARPVVAEPAAVRVSDDIAAAINRRSADGGAQAIWMAAAAAQAICDENGIDLVDGEALASFEGLPVVVRDHWRWGWVLVDAEPTSLAA